MNDGVFNIQKSSCVVESVSSFGRCINRTTRFLAVCVECNTVPCSNPHFRLLSAEYGGGAASTLDDTTENMLLDPRSMPRCSTAPF